MLAIHIQLGSCLRHNYMPLAYKTNPKNAISKHLTVLAISPHIIACTLNIINDYHVRQMQVLVILLTRVMLILSSLVNIDLITCIGTNVTVLYVINFFISKC